MGSKNHQYVEFSDQVVRRYVKTTIGMLTGTRVDPHRKENRVDWLLHSPESSFTFVLSANGRVESLVRKDINYEEEVIELYSPQEVTMFERYNRGAIEAGILIPYEEKAPEMDTSNILTDAQVTEIASTKQLPSLRKKLSVLTSIHSLDRIKQAVVELDRPLSIAKAVEERINELTGDNTR